MNNEKDKSREGGGTTEVALTRMSAGSAQPTEADRLRGIDVTVRAMARDRWTNPNALRAPDEVKVANAPNVVTAGPGRGWQEEKPLKSPMPKGSFIEGIVEGMVRKHVGGPNEPVKKE